MKTSSKIVALLTTSALALSLSGCGLGTDASEKQADDFCQQVAGIPADTVMFSVNGEDVTAEFYLYWLAYDCYYWNMYSSYYGSSLDFAAEVEDGVTTAQYLKNDAQSLTAYYILLAQQAKANGCELTDEQKAEWEQTKADYIEENGQEAYDLLLKQYGISEATFQKVNISGYYYDNLTDKLVSQPTDEEMAQYIKDEDLYLAKHILILTAEEGEDGTVMLSTGSAATNEDGSAYTGTAEEYNASALARATAILDQINTAADPLAKFDELMNQESEDTGLSSNPDGYTFTSTDSFVAEFKDTVYGLEYNQYSSLVKSDYGYHIILRLDPNSAALKEEYVAGQMSALVDGWTTNMEVVTTEAYDNLDVESFYTAYTAYQATFSEDETSATETPTGESSAAPTETAAPVETAAQ